MFKNIHVSKPTRGLWPFGLLVFFFGVIKLSGVEREIGWQIETRLNVHIGRYWSTPVLAVTADWLLRGLFCPPTGLPTLSGCVRQGDCTRKYIGKDRLSMSMGRFPHLLYFCVCFNLVSQLYRLCRSWIYTLCGSWILCVAVMYLVSSFIACVAVIYFVWRLYTLRGSCIPCVAVIYLVSSCIACVAVTYFVWRLYTLRGSCILCVAVIYLVSSIACVAVGYLVSSCVACVAVMYFC